MSDRPREQLIGLAYARLKGLQTNVPSERQFVPDVMWQDFNKAISDLRSAGFDLSAFQVSGSDMDDGPNGRYLFANVLRSRIDGLLVYFSFETGDAPRPRIGFEPPPAPG